MPLPRSVKGRRGRSQPYRAAPTFGGEDSEFMVHFQRGWNGHNRFMAAIHVTFEIPEDLSSKIAADRGALPQAALEGLALEAIRAGS